MDILKIGFHLIGDDAWRVGTIYLEDLFLSLREEYGACLDLCFLVNTTEQSIPIELRQATDQVLAYSPPRRWTRLWLIDRAAKRLFARDLLGEFFLRQNQIRAIVFGEAPSGSTIPTLGWIPDFQHVHLPDLFSAAERQSRNAEYLKIAERSTRVILLSEFVRKDFQILFPKNASKARVVSPVSFIPGSAYDDAPELQNDRYHLPRKFIYLPNQFWRHKNHRLAFHALKILKERGSDVFLVCSGFPGDYRHLTYFADLLQELSCWNVRDRVAFLGLLPRNDVLRLMRESVCVLNPSLFEGYGMTVEEARSLGKRLVLSDIPAHREQNPPQAVFFDPHSCEDLAEKLRRVWNEKSPGPDRELEAEARSSLPGRITQYARSFMSVIQEVVVE